MRGTRLILWNGIARYTTIWTIHATTSTIYALCSHMRWKNNSVFAVPSSITPRPSEMKWDDFVTEYATIRALVSTWFMFHLASLCSVAFSSLLFGCSRPHMILIYALTHSLSSSVSRESLSSHPTCYMPTTTESISISFRENVIFSISD